MLNLRKVLLAGLFVVLAMTGCTETEAEETQSPDALITEVAQTVQAGFDLTASAMPTEAPPTTEPTATPAPSPTLVPTAAAVKVVAPTIAVVSSCDVATFVSDITISDGTVIGEGEEFTKTWQLLNSGTCTWTSSYLLMFYSGSQMDGPDSQQLTEDSVLPGGTLNVSVDLVAPDDDGTYTGYWVLRNSSGVNFGLGTGGSPFYVQIVVGATSTPTATATDTSETSTPTATTAAATATTAPTTAPTATTAPTSTPEPTEVPTTASDDSSGSEG